MSTTQTKPLSERRAADRKQMAAEIEKLIVSAGCTFERLEGGDYPGPNRILLRVSAPRGLCVSVEFDGKSWQPDVHVLSWHMETGSQATLDPLAFGGNVNPFHFRKATYIANGFEELQQELLRGLELAVSGKAFREELCTAAPMGVRALRA